MNKHKIVKNASWIIGIQLVKAVLGIFVSMLTARFLGPSDFGLINYAASIVAFVTPIMNLGLTGVLVQELVNSPEDEGKILGTSVSLSFFSSLLCIAALFPLRPPSITAKQKRLSYVPYTAFCLSFKALNWYCIGFRQSCCPSIPRLYR